MLDGMSISILVVAAVLGILTIVLIWVFATTGNREIEMGDVLFGGSGARPHDGSDDGADATDGDGDGDGDGLEVNVATRGEPEEFEMLGVLYAVEGDQVETQTNNVLPLWGRQTYRRGHKWNYYAVLDNGIHLPLVIDGDDCEDAVGCDELADRDRLRIAQLGGTIYKFKKNQEPLIRYIPDVEA